MLENDLSAPLPRTEEELLDEFSRLRREYNGLSKTNPEHTPRRMAIKARYRRLDRRYGRILKRKMAAGGGNGYAERRRPGPSAPPTPYTPLDNVPLDSGLASADPFASDAGDSLFGKPFDSNSSGPSLLEEVLHGDWTLEEASDESPVEAAPPEASPEVQDFSTLLPDGQELPLVEDEAPVEDSAGENEPLEMPAAPPDVLSEEDAPGFDAFGIADVLDEPETPNAEPSDAAEIDTLPPLTLDDTKVEAEWGFVPEFSGVSEADEGVPPAFGGPIVDTPLEFQVEANLDIDENETIDATEATEPSAAEARHEAHSAAVQLADLVCEVATPLDESEASCDEVAEPRDTPLAPAKFDAPPFEPETEEAFVPADTPIPEVPRTTESPKKAQQPLYTRPAKSARRPRPARAARLFAILGWSIFLVGASFVAMQVIPAAREMYLPLVNNLGLPWLAELVNALQLGAMVMLFGGSCVGIGAFLGRSGPPPVPLHELVADATPDTLRDVVESGKSVSETDSRGHTPLHAAVVANRPDIAATLLELGADIEARTHKGETPLHLAVMEGDLDMAEFLLQRGADVFTKNNRDSTLLHVAAWAGDVRLLCLLHQKKLWVNAKALTGYTPLHFAAQGGHLDAIRYLIEIGADIQAMSVKGNTPLYAAAKNGHLEAVKALIEAGADPEIQRAQGGHSPAAIAMENGHAEVLAYLKEHGAHDECPAE